MSGRGRDPDACTLDELRGVGGGARASGLPPRFRLLAGLVETYLNATGGLSLSIGAS